MNQCDGCKAGRPLNKSGFHRMSDGRYIMACTKHLYESPKPGTGGDMTGVASYYRFGVLPVPRHEPTIPQPYDGSRLDCSMWNGCTETQWREVWYKRMEPIEDEV